MLSSKLQSLHYEKIASVLTQTQRVADVTLYVYQANKVGVMETTMTVVSALLTENIVTVGNKVKSSLHYLGNKSLGFFSQAKKLLANNNTYSEQEDKTLTHKFQIFI